MSKRQQARLSRNSLKRDLGLLVLGAVLGAGFSQLLSGYIIPLYYSPHSDLSITKYHVWYFNNPYNYYFDILNAGGAPVDWMRIKFTATDGIIQNVSWHGSPLDVTFQQLSADGTEFALLVEHVQPNDRERVNITNSVENADYTLDVHTSTQYILGDIVEIIDAANISQSVGKLTPIPQNRT
jgi:hypothetical protein